MMNCVEKWGRLRKLQKTAAPGLGFWIHLKQINTFDDGFFIRKAERNLVCQEQSAFAEDVQGTTWNTGFVCLHLCFSGWSEASTRSSKPLSPVLSH